MWPVFGRFEARVVKAMGVGFLVEFPSAVRLSARAPER